MLRNVKLGIPGLDERLGGIPDGSLLLIIGDAEAPFHLIARQSLFNKALEGGKVVYVNIDESKDDIVSEMESLHWVLRPLEVSGNWTFINCEARPERAFAFLETRFREVVSKGAWTCIDTFTSLLNLDRRRALSLLSLMLKIVRSGGIHYLLVVKQFHEEEVLDRLKYMCDVVMEVELPRDIRRPLFLLRVPKIRRKPFSGLVVSFTVDERGVVIETLTRIL
ncbi:MAG: hypothetical protein DRN15_01200 [Thermoprotei archaeon]|nr:MAG: hypothetical protein DRN15_01200 [Thermoprotei archaeon]RLF25809.1 MAG: hypothetical protein DRM97_00615 [Thermoprotei archaeon]